MIFLHALLFRWKKWSQKLTQERSRSSKRHKYAYFQHWSIIYLLLNHSNLRTNHFINRWFLNQLFFENFWTLIPSLGGSFEIMEISVAVFRFTFCSDSSKQIMLQRFCGFLCPNQDFWSNIDCSLSRLCIHVFCILILKENEIGRGSIAHWKEEESSEKEYK